MIVRPYGSWPSPITPQLLTAGAVGISEVVVDGDDIWWAESRPSEGGRTALVRWRGGVTEEITPEGANVRTLVHEYGGAAWWADRGVLYYVEFADQRLRRLTPGTAPVLLTVEPAVPRAHRYADGRVSADQRWFLCVRERHEAEGEPVNELVRIATDGSGDLEVLASGADFYAGPRPSPDGRHLAWIQWNHPNMPWDDTELWLAELADVPGTAHRLAAGSVAHIQPQWSPDGALHVLADDTDRWGVRRWDGSALVPVLDDPVGEIGGPPWVFGQSDYAFFDDHLAATVTRGESRHAAFAWATSVTSLRAHNGASVAAVASWQTETVVARDGEVLRPARDLALDPAFLPSPESITFPTLDGELARAFYFAPAGAEFTGPDDERPPLLVLAHGGPTSAARTQLDLGVRFWTSRGIAVVDVDYRGSSGYGRAYRRRLYGEWGLLDVSDCIAAARFLAERGDIDGERLVIRGGSAGGFTVLSALTFHHEFAAGASRYGVADLEVLGRDTHKFEARYLDQLVGPYPSARDRYLERSPIHHVERLRTPTIVLQGSEDTIVPPNQAELIVAALDRNGVPHSYLLFEGEQHGFRRADTIVTALQAELAFFGAVLGFTPADDLPPLAIAHGGRLHVRG